MSFFHILLIFLLLLQTCGESREESQRNSNSDSDSVYVDSQKSDSISTPEPAGPGLAPGQAKVQATAIATDSSDNKIRVTFEVRSVLEYGSSTTPIPSGDTLRFDLNKKDSDTSIEIDEEFTLLLQQQMLLESSRPGWSLIEVIN